VERHLRTLAVPDSARVTAEYPIAVLARAPRRKAAREFVELVMSSEGQAILEQRGLIRAAPPAP
jgi:ABC-type molybdate transport system substrate-binding protein